MTAPLRLMVAGRTFVEPAATTFLQDGELSQVLGQTGRIVVGVAQTTDTLEASLHALLMGPMIPPFLARALVEEGKPTPGRREPYLAGVAALEDLFGGVTDPAEKQAMMAVATELLLRFFGSGLSGSRTSLSSSATPATMPTSPFPSVTTSPATAPGADSSTPSRDTTLAASSAG